MEKCKTFTWILCAAAILAALGVAIYFIVDDARDQKIKSCITKHFDSLKMFSTFNATPPIDPSTITYSAEDCDSVVQGAYKLTRAKVDELPYSLCVKEKFKDKPFLDTITFWAVLQKMGVDAGKILIGSVAKAGTICGESSIQVN